MNRRGDRGYSPLMEEEHDRILLDRVAAGDERAFEALYERHATALFAYARTLLGESGPAEEALQDTFVAVWHNAAAFEGRSAVRTWLFGICRRQALKRTRGQQLRVVPVEDAVSVASDAPEPETVVLARADAEAVAAAFTRLPAHHREVLQLAFAAGLPVTEIARVLGVPVGTVKSRLFHARATLAKALPTGAERTSR